MLDLIKLPEFEVKVVKLKLIDMLDLIKLSEF